MKLKYTIAALAVTTISAQAATVSVNQGDPTSGTHTNHAGPMYGQSITAPATAMQVVDVTFQIRDGVGGQLAGTANRYIHVYDSLTISNSGANEGDITAWGNLIGVSDNTQNVGDSATDLSAVTWNFTNVAVTGSQQYWFVLSSGTVAETGVDGSGFELVTGSPYAGGYSPASNSFHSNSLDWDLNFSANFDTTAVPEPSSTALLGLGGLALILRRRK